MGNFFEDKFNSNRLENSDYMRRLLQPFYPGGELIFAKSEDILSIDYFIKKGVIKKRYHDYGDLLIETKSCAETGSPSWVGKAKFLPSTSLFYVCYDFSKEEAKNPGNCVDEILATYKRPSTFICFNFAMFVETWEEYKDYWMTRSYNTGSAFTHYDDGVEHSLWLSLMRPRLDLIHGLLAPEGSLWITIDDNECHYLKVFCDEVFGRHNFVATCVWEKDKGGRGDADISLSHDNILVYAKNRAVWASSRNLLPRTETQLGRLKNPDNDPRGPWRQEEFGRPLVSARDRALGQECRQAVEVSSYSSRCCRGEYEYQRIGGTVHGVLDGSIHDRKAAGRDRLTDEFAGTPAVQQMSEAISSKNFRENI